MIKVRVVSGKMGRRKPSRAKAGDIEYIMHWRRSSDKWTSDIFETSRVLVRHHLGGGLFMDIPVDVPTEIETGKMHHDDPVVGMRDSRKAAKILGGMPGVHVPEEYHYGVDWQPRKKTVKIKGKSLYDVIMGLEKKDAPTEFTIGDAKKAVALMKKALKALHKKGVYHGDVHPSNIILTRDPEIADPKLGIGIGIIDWGRSAYKSKKGDDWMMDFETAYYVDQMEELLAKRSH